MSESDNNTILIVDDIPSFRAILRDMLADMGFTHFVEAADGAEALRMLKEKHIKLVISDYMMTPVTGLEFLRSMRADTKLKLLPFIMVSAVGEQDVISEAIELGANGYIVKPIGFDVLRTKVIEALTAHH